MTQVTARSLARLTPWEFGEDKEYAYLLYTAAGICGALKDTDCAFNQLERAVRFDNRYRKDIVAIGLAVGRPGLVMDHADTLLLQNPDDLQTVLMGARAAIAVGDVARSTKFLNQALTIAPENPGVLKVMGAARERDLYRP